MFHEDARDMMRREKVVAGEMQVLQVLGPFEVKT